MCCKRPLVLKVNWVLKYNLIVLVFILKKQVNMNKDNKLPDAPSTITLSDDVLDDIYSDMQADQTIMLEQSGLYE